MLQSIRNRWFAPTLVMLLVFVAVTVCVIPDARAQAPMTTGDLRRIVGNPTGLVAYNTTAKLA